MPLQLNVSFLSPVSLSVSVPVSRCCSPTSSNKWVQTGVWYWRQCSWYFLSVTSQFSTERRWGLWQTGSGEGGDTVGWKIQTRHQSTKRSPSQLRLWKRKRHFSSLPVCPAPLWAMLAVLCHRQPVGPRGPAEIKPTKINVKNECFNSKCKMHSRIRDDFSFFLFFLHSCS